MQVFKKTGKNILFFIILFFILAGVSGVIESALTKNDSFVPSRNKSYYRIRREPEQTVDVLVLGDSLSYSSFAPPELWDRNGITSFLCAQSGQKIQESYLMLETAMKTQSPKLVILETNAMFRGQSGIAGLQEIIESWGNNYISIFRSHDVWKSFLIDKEYPEENFKGFLYRTDIQPYEQGPYMIQTKEQSPFPEQVPVYMEKIQDLCREKGADLLLVSTPSPKNYNYARHNSLASYAAENGIPYLDMNLKLNEIGIDWKKDTLDKGDHLNYSGAHKVTTCLAKYLNEQYDLPDHRGEKGYSSWTHQAKTYHGLVGGNVPSRQARK